MAFRGHDERADSANRGNFVEVLKSFAVFDATMADHLRTSTVFTGTSKTIQNELVESIAAVITEHIDAEIKHAPFIAVQVDETTDVSNKSQLTVIVRYVNGKGCVCERFLGFYDVSANRDAKALAAITMKAIEAYNPTAKLICQTYDGASCMSGQHGGVQAIVKTQCPNALFIHCYAHKLNLVLAQGTTKDIPAANRFFSNVHLFYTFFSRSSKRTALLSEVDGSVRVPGGSAVRWNFKSRAVHAIHEGRESLLTALDRIMNEPGWDRETTALSESLKEKLENFDFCFLLCVFRTIFGLTEPLFQVLQSKAADIKKCQERVKGTLSAIKLLRTDETFSGLYDEAVQLVGEPAPRRKRRRRGWDDFEQGFSQHQDAEEETLDAFRLLYFQIIDGITVHMTERFSDMGRINFFRLLDHSSFSSFSKPNAFPREDLVQLIQVYPFFEEKRLHNELLSLYGNAVFHLPPSDLLRLLVEDDLQNTFSQVYSLLQLMLTIPATSTSAERSFSCLKRIKTYLRNSCGQERLVNLSKISINSAVVDELTANDGKFYDDVIDHFANMKDRRIALLYK